MRIRRPRSALLASLLPAALLIAALHPALAQGPAPATEVEVVVLDPAGGPLVGAEVSVRPLDAAADVRGSQGTSDQAGKVRIPVAAGAATIAIRRMGFVPHTASVMLLAGRLNVLSVNLVSSPQELAEMKVTDRRTADVTFMEGFHQRRTRGFGNFITREQIAERRPVVMTDMVRTMPGIRMVFQGGLQVPRFSRSQGRSGVDCPPQFWIDNMRVDNVNLDAIQPGDVEGMEFYGLSSTPPQFMSRAGTGNCGTIVIWTRRA